MSNFSGFSRSVFKRHALQTRKNQGLFGKGLRYKTYENTVGQGEIARNEQFLLFPKVFLCSLEEFSVIFTHFKLLSANSLNLEESKPCRLEKC